MTLTGPILQFLGCQNGVWGLSLMIVCSSADPQPALRLNVPAELVNGASGPVPGLDATAWRFDIAVRQTPSAQRIGYRLAGRSHSFQVPALGATPSMAYVSCNGFSDARTRKSMKVPNALWARLGRLHEQQERVDGVPVGPLELLLMGGDQIYSDDIWSTVPELREWTETEWFTRTHMAFSDSLRAALQTRFAEFYLERWNQTETAALLASVPSVMMWDDHDIIDGWGSHMAELHGSPVFQGIFQVAKAAFELFQRQMLGAPPPATLPAQTTHNSAYRFGHTGLLVLDLRSERRPRSESTDTAGRKTVLADQVMSPASWSAVYAWLDAQLAAGDLRHLLVMSSIPVMHPSFEQLETMLGALPAIEELEDDLRDHWTSHPHQAERLRLYCGLKRQDAVDFLRAHPLTISRSECAEIDAAVQAEQASRIAAAYDEASGVKFARLPDRAQTVIVSLAFQYGANLARRCPRFWHAAIVQDWPAAMRELAA